MKNNILTFIINIYMSNNEDVYWDYTEDLVEKQLTNAEKLKHDAIQYMKDDPKYYELCCTFLKNDKDEDLKIISKGYINIEYQNDADIENLVFNYIKLLISEIKSKN